MLSLATDLAMGQPLEHGLRTAMLALRTAQAMDLPEEDQVTVFYTGVLHFAGCTAESEIDARFFGDELAARPRMMTVAYGSRLELIATAMRVAHSGSGPLARAVMMARAAFGGIAEFRKWAASHCDAARLLGARMGLSGAGPAGAAASVRTVGRQRHAGRPARHADPAGGPADAGRPGRRCGPAARRDRAGAQHAGQPGRVGTGPGGGQRLPGGRRSAVQGPGRAVRLGRGGGRRAGSAAGGVRAATGCLPVGDRGFRRPEEHVDRRSFPRASPSWPDEPARWPGWPPRR